MIRRTERLDVELARGVHDAGLRGGIDLQFCVVRGRGDGRSELPRALDDGNGKRRALGGIRTGAELIEQDERAVAAGVQNSDDVGHMRRERRQALLDALLVADVRHDLVEHGQAAAVGGGNVQTALRHHGEQAHGLERDRLAAGVRAGDDKGVKVRAERHVDGHDGVLRDERMSRPSERHALLHERRRGGVHLVGELGLGKNDVEAHEHVEVQRNILAVGSTVCAELGEDALDLGLFLRAELAQLVVRLHGRHRLDEERRAGTGNIVDEPRYRALVLGLDGHDIALGARGDDGFLQRLGIARRGDDLLQRVMDSRAGRADQSADGGQLRRSRVRDLVLPDDGARDLFLQEFVRLQGVEKIIDAGLFLALEGAVAAHASRGGKDAGDVDELARIQHAAHVRALQARAHILHARERGTALDYHELAGSSRLVETARDLGAVAGGAEHTGDVLRRSGGRLCRKQIQHGRQLQCFQRSNGLFFHRSFTFFQ